MNKNFYSSTIYIKEFLYKDTLIDTINLQTIYDFMDYCRELGNGDVTINTNVRAILYYFMRLAYLEELQVVEPKRNTQPIETYTNAELRILMTKKCRLGEYRNWVICNFLLATGARLSIVAELKVEDWDY